MEDLYSYINLVSGTDDLRVILDSTNDLLIFDMDDDNNGALNVIQDLAEGRVFAMGGDWADHVATQLGGYAGANLTSVGTGLFEVTGAIMDGANPYDITGSNFVDQLY